MGYKRVKASTSAHQAVSLPEADAYSRLHLLRSPLRSSAGRHELPKSGVRLRKATACLHRNTTASCISHSVCSCSAAGAPRRFPTVPRNFSRLDCSTAALSQEAADFVSTIAIARWLHTFASTVPTASCCGMEDKSSNPFVRNVACDLQVFAPAAARAISTAKMSKRWDLRYTSSTSTQPAQYTCDLLCNSQEL